MNNLEELLYECLPYLPEDLQEKVLEVLDDKFELVWISDLQSLDEVKLYEKTDRPDTRRNYYN